MIAYRLTLTFSANLSAHYLGGRGGGKGSVHTNLGLDASGSKNKINLLLSTSRSITKS